ncbi:MAG: hypothetical protein ONB37_17270 [candidate division KSB1 bacterium]|nr:hypothetical protein [candidate division KSB1 bacterium]
MANPQISILTQAKGIENDGQSPEVFKTKCPCGGRIIPRAKNLQWQADGEKRTTSSTSSEASRTDADSESLDEFEIWHVHPF